MGKSALSLSVDISKRVLTLIKANQSEPNLFGRAFGLIYFEGIPLCQSALFHFLCGAVFLPLHFDLGHDPCDNGDNSLQGKKKHPIYFEPAV